MNPVKASGRATLSGLKLPLATCTATAAPQPTTKIAAMDQAAQVDRVRTVPPSSLELCHRSEFYSKTVPRSLRGPHHDDRSDCPARRLQRPANEASGHLGRPHPPVELVTVAATPEPRSSTPVVPSACP